MGKRRFLLAASVAAVVVVMAAAIGAAALGGGSTPSHPGAAVGRSTTPSTVSASERTMPTTLSRHPEATVESPEIPPEPVAPAEIPPEPVLTLEPPEPAGTGAVVPEPDPGVRSPEPTLPTPGEPVGGGRGSAGSTLGELATGAVAHPDLPLGTSPQVPAPAGPGGGPGGFSVGTGCASTCITRGVALPRGTGARLEVDTHTPARIWILVWQDGSTQTLQFDSGPGSLVTSFAADIDDLEPGTTYMAMAVAQDAAGWSDHASGSFTTLERRLHIDFETPDVQSWPDGDVVDAYVRVKVDGGWQPDHAWTTGLPSIEGAPRTLDLEARVVVVTEHDSGPWDLDQAFDVTLMTQPTGSIDGNTWVVTALDDVDLDAHPGDDAWWDGHTLHRTLEMPEWGGSLPADYGSSLALSIPVNLIVTYE